MAEWQPFYGRDGKYVVCRNGNEELILGVQWSFAG
jgi:hypothetical protein